MRKEEEGEEEEKKEDEDEEEKEEEDGDKDEDEGKKHSYILLPVLGVNCCFSKGVFAKNERGYRRNAKNKRF